MAVQISEDIPSSEVELDPRYVADSFVEPYYHLLRVSPEIVHKFYNHQSVIDRSQPDGELASITSTQDINNEIMSSDYKGCSFRVINIDAQASLMGGVLVVVNGIFTGKDNLERSFNQTFFLAKQPKGYFVLNDILRFSEVQESELSPSSNGTEESSWDIPVTHYQDSPAQHMEVVDGGEKLLDTESGKKLPGITTGKRASKVDSGKKTVSAIKDTAVAPYSPANRSENESIPTHAASNERQETRKTSYASVVAKEGKVTSPTSNTGFKIVRVAPNADQQSTALAILRDPGTMANCEKELIASNVADGSKKAEADALAPKSIYIANLPWNITRQRLIDTLKIFGPIRPGGIQIRTYEDGFCFGFVEFESASSASEAVKVHNVTVGGKLAYMMYKKSDGSKSGNSGGKGGSCSGNSKGQDTRGIHGNDSRQNNGQADIKGQPQCSGGQKAETKQKSHHKVGRAHSKSRQLTDERSLIWYQKKDASKQ